MNTEEKQRHDKDIRGRYRHNRNEIQKNKDRHDRRTDTNKDRHRGKMAGAIGEHNRKEPVRYDVTEEKCRHIRKIQTNKDMIGQRGIRRDSTERSKDMYSRRTQGSRRGHRAMRTGTRRRHRGKVSAQ